MFQKWVNYLLIFLINFSSLGYYFIDDVVEGLSFARFCLPITQYADEFLVDTI